MKIWIHGKFVDVENLRLTHTIHLTDEGWKLGQGKDNFSTLYPCVLNFDYLFYTDDLEDPGFNYVINGNYQSKGPELLIDDISKFLKLGVLKEV